MRPFNIHLLLVSSSPFLSRCVPADVTSQAGSLFSGTGAQSLAEDLVRDFQNCSAELVSAESSLWRVISSGAGPDGPGGAGTLHPHHGALPLPRRHHRLRHHRGRCGGSTLPCCGVRVVTDICRRAVWAAPSRCGYSGTSRSQTWVGKRKATITDLF